MGPECLWFRGLPPPVSSLQMGKGSHASWCHCVPLHYHETGVSQQHVPLSSHSDGLDVGYRRAVGFSQASSFLARLADAMLLLPGARRDQCSGPVIQTIICTITLPQDCFLLLLSMGEAVCFFAVFPTLFPKENHAGRRGCMQAGVLKPQVPAPFQRLRGVL